MSRIGSQPISIPSGTSVKVNDDVVTGTGPLGTLTQQLHPHVTAVLNDNSLLVQRRTETKSGKALHGLTRALLFNLVTGVSTGFKKRLELVGTGYRVIKQGNDISLSVGFSHPVVVSAVDGISFEVEGNTAVTVSGIDKYLVGQIASNIRAVRPPEPYKGKGIRYAGEQVRRKAGKQAKTTTTK